MAQNTTTKPIPATPIPATPRSLHEMPTAADYEANVRARNRRYGIGGLLLAALTAGSYVAFGNDNLAVPIVLLVLLITFVLLWRFPRAILYLTLASVCLFEIFPTGYSDALTDKIPFFQNVNTIIETYGHFNPHIAPFNLFEVFAVIAGTCSLFRSVYTGTVGLRFGPLIKPIVAYMIFVLIGWVNGMVTGGDFKISLQEVRSQVYLLLAYLIALNLVSDRRHLNGVLWLSVLCIGFKGILYTFRRFVTLAGQPIPDQGVGSHEEAFFFDCFIVLLMVLSLCGTHKKLRALMWILLPVVVSGEVACNRRAATAAFIVVIPMLIIAAYRALPDRRRVVGAVGIFLAISFPIYYQAFKNSPSMYAEPARAIKSQFQPDDRDASSNAYRDAEAIDLYATIKSSPIIGYGYGKPMFHVAQIADISQQYEWWDIMTHNQILWVWMRVGTIGFFTFWMLICAILIYASSVILAEGADAFVKAIGLFTMLVTGMLLIFGLLDLQLSNFRDMLFVGMWLGLLGSVSEMAPTLVTPRDMSDDSDYTGRTGLDRTVMDRTVRARTQGGFNRTNGVGNRTNGAFNRTNGVGNRTNGAFNRTNGSSNRTNGTGR